MKTKIQLYVYVCTYTYVRTHNSLHLVFIFPTTLSVAYRLLSLQHFVSKRLLYPVSRC